MPVCDAYKSETLIFTPRARIILYISNTNKVYQFILKTITLYIPTSSSTSSLFCTWWYLYLHQYMQFRPRDAWWSMWLFVKQLFLICPLKRRKNCWPNMKPHILDDDWCTVSFSWSNRLCSLSTLWVWLKVCSFLADDGSLQCMINSRFGRICTFKIPEYNIFFYIVYYKNRTAFKMKPYL